MKPFELLAEAAIKGAPPKAVIEVGVQEGRKPGSIKEAVYIKVYGKFLSFAIRVMVDDKKDVARLGKHLKPMGNVSNLTAIPKSGMVLFDVTAKSKGEAVNYVRDQLKRLGIEGPVKVMKEQKLRK